MIVQKLGDYTDYWNHLLKADRDAFLAKPDDLRLALHYASALFHMHDWVYWGNESYIKTHFTFADKHGEVSPVKNSIMVANALRDCNIDFELVRGIANAGKHLHLKSATKKHHTNAPNNATNTVVQSSGWGIGGYGVGPYGGSPRVMLVGPNGQDLEFSDLGESTYQMWIKLSKQHGWELYT